MVNTNNKDNNSNKLSDKLTAIVLAGGKGTRMASPLPKVLHPVAGRPMIEYVIDACKGANVEDIRIVVGHGSQLVGSVVHPRGINTYLQEQQLGTGDAVKSARVDSIEGLVVILNGDHPLVETADILGFLKSFKEQNLDLAIISSVLKNPKDFGRVIKNKDQLVAIVEAKDASSDTLKIKEVNTGNYVVKADVLKECLPHIKNNNMKEEFYLTDLISICAERGYKMAALRGSQRVAFGVNNQIELAQATKYKLKKNCHALMEKGVLMIAPETCYIESGVKISAGAVIHPNVYLKGQTAIGSFTVIEPNCFIQDSIIAEGVQIKANSHLDKCVVHARASVGPFARLRPETEIGEEAHVGNFVEMKKVRFGKKSKAVHLTYLGDAEVGEEVNIGCGTITCNYATDHKKYKTIIGNKVFVGSDTQFVAPIKIGDEAVIGSGSTITKDVPARALAVARSKQFVKENYVQSTSAANSAAGKKDNKE